MLLKTRHIFVNGRKRHFGGDVATNQCHWCCNNQIEFPVDEYQHYVWKSDVINGLTQFFQVDVLEALSAC